MQPSREWGGQYGSVGADFVLHPLIYSFSSRKDTAIGGAGQKEQECALKYVIHIPGDQPKLQMNMFTLSNEIIQAWGV